MPQPSKVIIDTDPGIDDAIAIMIALYLKDLEVIGITTVNGNVSSKTGVINSRKILEVAGRSEIPVIMGAERPIVRKPLVPSGIHGDGGLGSLILPADAKMPKTPYLDFMENALRTHRKGELSIIAIGPLTNIAKMVLADADLFNQFSETCIMGGTFGLDGRKACGNVTPYSEFNFYCDPEAAQIVLNAKPKGDLKLVGLDITGNKSCLVGKDFLSKLKPHPTWVVAKMAVDLLGFAIKKHDFFDLPDAFAVAMHAVPEMFRFSKGKITVTSSGTMRGRSKFQRDSGDVSVAVNVDVKRFNRFVFENLRH